MASFDIGLMVSPSNQLKLKNKSESYGRATPLPPTPLPPNIVLLCTPVLSVLLRLRSGKGGSGGGAGLEVCSLASELSSLAPFICEAGLTVTAIAGCGCLRE